MTIENDLQTEVGPLVDPVTEKKVKKLHDLEQWARVLPAVGAQLGQDLPGMEILPEGQDFIIRCNKLSAVFLHFAWLLRRDLNLEKVDPADLPG